MVSFELMKGLVNIHASKLTIENIGHSIVITDSLEVRFIRLIIENTIEETGDIARLIQFIAQLRAFIPELNNLFSFNRKKFFKWKLYANRKRSWSLHGYHTPFTIH